jgi:pimeloyl-ACP methyl ester carboxylesterase
LVFAGHLDLGVQRWSLEHGMMVRRTGSGPSIVWMHGLGESSVSFEPVVAAMPGFAHVLVDLPGYGRSPWPAQPMGLDELAEHLARWVDPDAVVIGHSMGGVLAGLVAERTRVRRVVDVEGNVTLGDCHISGIAAAIDDPIRALEAVIEQLTAVPRAYEAALAFAMPAMFHRHAKDLVAVSASDTLAARVASLGALFVAGVPDGICDASKHELDRAGARWIGIERAGHWVYLDQTRRFVDEVTRFITEP